MTAKLPLPGPEQAPASSGSPPGRILVLLHGLGADGQDLIGLADALAHRFPDCLFQAPDAPEPCDMVAYGRQWFSLQDRRPEAISAGAARAARLLDAHLDALLARHGLPPERLALLGFSQGCMMALQVGPRRAEALGGIIGFSGLLPNAGSLVAEARSRPPVLLVHGLEDAVVPAMGSAHAQGALEAAGLSVKVEWRPDLGHGIDPGGIALAERFLTRIWPG